MTRTAKDRRDLIDLMRGYADPKVRRARQGRERGEKPKHREARRLALLERLRTPPRLVSPREKYRGQRAAHLVGASRPMSRREIAKHNAEVERRRALGPAEPHPGEVVWPGVHDTMHTELGGVQ